MKSQRPKPVETKKTETLDVAYSQAKREISKYGYVKYNITDCDEIYIAKAPESALFNGGDPVFVKAVPDQFVGKTKVVARMELDDVRIEPKPASQLFANIQRGSSSDIQSYVG